MTQKHISQMTKHHKKPVYVPKMYNPLLMNGLKALKTSHKDTNLFDLQGWEYNLYEVVQNVHLVSTPFLQLETYETSCCTFCVASIPIAKDIGDEIFSRYIEGDKCLILL
jgi:hypothetical protein